MTRPLSRSSKPAWDELGGSPAQLILKADARAQVCVIGAGVAGLSAAYLLACAGKSVVVLDENAVGGGESGRTTAHLTCALDAGYAEIERLHGAEAARLAAQSHEVAIKRIAAIVSEEGLECGFEEVDGFLFSGSGRDTGGLDAEFAAARRAGLHGVELLPRAPLYAFDTGPCLRYPRQAQLEPARYLRGLAAAVVRRGGRIYAGTRAAAIEGGEKARVTTSSGERVTADSVIVATNSPVNDRVAILIEQAAYRTYVIALSLPSGIISKALYWDTDAPYHYVRFHTPVEGPALLIVGGEDHLTGQADDGDQRYARLETWARARFVSAGEVVARWSGQVVEPLDGLAYIGRNPLDHTNVYIATGHSGNGMTYGMIAGMLLSDLILGRRNDWADVYEPSRITPGVAVPFVERGLNAAVQYAEGAFAGDLAAPKDLAAGCGAVLRCGLNQTAVYRDAAGALHKLSPVCPHLGGTVRWNSTENSWDCPVHGARYDALGRALNGPAPADLEKAG
jgi:glycine/D-amino acid oxidase-like deaminating enzyme/nitrite reductase/ring-hydroxylating ferredoxin subunit